MNALDQDAAAIGRLYRIAKSSDNRIFYLAEIGNRLLSKKETLGHGRWLEWLGIYRSALGFSERGAGRFISGAQWMASNWQLANRLEEVATNPRATEEDIAAADEIKRTISQQFRPMFRGTLGRRENEWHTPRQYITLARDVLGDIDLDPASNECAQETIKAHRYFDKEQNGLRWPWDGRVWLNPPYSQPLISQFMRKLLMEWDAKRVVSCIALTNNFTDTAWFSDTAAMADAICFTQGRVKFHNRNGEVVQPTQGQAFFYFGPEVEAFKRTFGRIGLLMRPEVDSWSRRRVRDGSEMVAGGA
jgi:phage N-6-adenine-methyltransferase